MTHAYDETYVASAQRSLGRMLDFAVYELHYEIGTFFSLFIATGLADLFGSGDPEIVAGMSGIELAFTVLEKAGIPEDLENIRFPIERSEEFWTGWALAWYQWRSNLSFSEIIQAVPIEEIQNMYYPYHEMDLRQFEYRMNELINSKTHLQRRREAAGLSLYQLAKQSGISMETIRQYEMREADINSATAATVAQLAGCLNCLVRDLLEILPRSEQNISGDISQSAN